MARFYQPRNTQGVYEPGPNRLTVNQFDSVAIGFQASNLTEYQATKVDTSEDVEDGRAAINPTTIEINIKSAKAVTVTVSATQEVMMSAIPKNMCRPLQVVIRRRLDENIPAVGQERDPAGCWAACLSYYLSVAPGRHDRRFVDILGDFSGLWDQLGLIRVALLQQQLGQQKTRYRMTTALIPPNRLSEFVGRWPMVVGFLHPGGFGHMNVLTAYDADNDLARAMDPWFPDPPPGSITREFGPLAFNGTEGNFRFQGGFYFRPLAFFRAMHSGNIFIGFPEEYLSRMP
jgi:hypothetical protein